MSGFCKQEQRSASEQEQCPVLNNNVMFLNKTNVLVLIDSNAIFYTKTVFLNKSRVLFLSKNNVLFLNIVIIPMYA